MAATTTFQPTGSHFSPSSHGGSPTMTVDHIESRSPVPTQASSGHTANDGKTAETANAVTPTRRDFGGLPGQLPLPTTPFTPSAIVTTPDTERSDTDLDEKRREAVSGKRDADDDVDMIDDDDDDQNDSENDSNTSDSQRPKKKKKGQRFFCTDFPPCNLSFTRSEHLARHIRKHTGERPFQCHCSRRFSRLDNLRQHAQTVHVNEEIPGDSLAATGTRFQRQIRTDRVRAPGGRSRAGTNNSISSHGRGHSRNLSSSSVASTASNVSSLPDDGRRRPPPLAMAQDASRGRLTLDTYAGPGTAPPTQYAYYTQQSPSGYSTHRSATFSTGGNSPRFPVQSPTMAPRAAYYPQARSARRLSVPSVASPYQTTHMSTYPPAYFSPLPPAAPYHAATASASSIASPTSSTYSHSRRDSDAELEWRRRTWHPGTYAAHVQRPATSGLMYQQTPDDARPTTAGQPAATQVTRLPGIESFDHAPPTASNAAQRPPSPMHIDGSGRPPVYLGPADTAAPGPDTRRSQSVWEASLHQNLNRLDITNTTPPRHAPNTSHQRAPLPTFVFPQAPPPSEPAPTSAAVQSSENLNVDNRRRGWYGGPTSASSARSQPININYRRSPEESVSSDGIPTPSTSQGTEAHPSIVHSNGMIETRPPGMITEEQRQVIQAREASKPEPVRTDSGSHLYGHYSSGSQGGSYVLQSGHESRPTGSYTPPAQGRNGMTGLEALVAVATSENAQR